MELCKEHKTICLNECCRTVKENIDLDLQENLPQYLDDIEKVIKCSVKTTVTDYDYQGNSINVYGRTLVCITYKSANSGLLSCIFEEDFSRNFEVENVENFSFAKIQINTKYSNYHLINQRRLDIHSSLIIRINIYYQSSVNCLCSCEKAMLKKYTQDYLVCKMCGVSAVEFEENVSISDNNSQIKSIVNCFTSCTVDEYKIIKDKMLVKGSVTAGIVYECINGNTDKKSHRFSFSKIIEASSIDENDKAFINAQLSGLYIKAKADENNNLSIIEIVGRIIIDYQILRVDNISFNIDCYVPKFSTQLNKATTRINEAPIYYFDDKMLEINFESDNPLVEVIDFKAEIVNQSVVNSSLVTEIGICILYYDDKGNICYSEKSDEQKIVLSNDEMSGISSCTMKSFDYVIKSAGTLMLRANIEYMAYLFKENDVSLITDVLTDDTPNNINTPQLTLYFADENEKIWDIAKKFSTSEKLIIDENNLSSDLVDCKRILLIPGM